MIVTKSTFPFPHIVIDNFLENKRYALAASALDSLFAISSVKEFSNSIERKSILHFDTLGLGGNLSPLINGLLESLSSSEILGIISDSLGFCGDIIPLISLQSGAHLSFFHSMKSNSTLGPHVDHSFLVKDKKYYKKVANSIFYIPPAESWDESNGGHTCLHKFPDYWTKKTIQYKPNRLIVFLHDSRSIHSVTPLRSDIICPRRSIYMDYYSEIVFDLPSSRSFLHGTTFFPTPATLGAFIFNPVYLKSLAYYVIKSLSLILKP